MAKKEVNLTEEKVEAVNTEKKSTKSNVNNKDNKKGKQTKKVNKDKKGLGKKVKETFTELKKVSWPSFGKVAKSTLVVIVVVLAFAVALFGIDYLLNLPFGLLTNNG